MWLGFVVLSALLTASCERKEGDAKATQPAAAAPSKEDVAATERQRGSYLMTTLGCNDCHTPHDEKGQPIAALYLAGHPANAPLPEWSPDMLKQNVLMTMDPTGTAFAGPWGVSVAGNLTPDMETGIGKLSAEDLILSWKNNKHWKVDRPILPPMPAPGYASLPDSDIRAIHAFLKSLPPIKNAAPASVLAPPPMAAPGAK